jgi:hypothetical protein
VIKSDESKSVHERSARNAQDWGILVRFAGRCGSDVTLARPEEHNSLDGLKNSQKSAAKKGASARRLAGPKLPVVRRGKSLIAPRVTRSARSHLEQ